MKNTFSKVLQQLNNVNSGFGYIFLKKYIDESLNKNIKKTIGMSEHIKKLEEYSDFLLFFIKSDYVYFFFVNKEDRNSVSIQSFQEDFDIIFLFWYASSIVIDYVKKTNPLYLQRPFVVLNKEKNIFDSVINNSNLLFIGSSIYNLKQKDKEQYVKFLEKYGIIILMMNILKEHIMIGYTKKISEFQKNIMFGLPITNSINRVFSSNEIIGEIYDDLTIFGIYDENEKVIINNILEKILLKKFKKVQTEGKSVLFESYDMKYLIFENEKSIRNKIYKNSLKEDCYKDISNESAISYIIFDLLNKVGNNNKTLEEIYLYNEAYYSSFGIQKKEEYLEDINVLVENLYEGFKQKKNIYKKSFLNFFEDQIRQLKSNIIFERKIQKFYFGIRTFLGRQDFIFQNIGYYNNSIISSIENNKIFGKFRYEVFELVLSSLLEFYNNSNEDVKKIIESSLSTFNFGHLNSLQYKGYFNKIHEVSGIYSNLLKKIENNDQIELFDFQNFHKHSLFLEDLYKQKNFQFYLFELDRLYDSYTFYEKLKGTFLEKFFLNFIFLNGDKVNKFEYNQEEIQYGKESFLSCIDNYQKLQKTYLVPKDKINFQTDIEKVKKDFLYFLDILEEKQKRNTQKFNLVFGKGN